MGPSQDKKIPLIIDHDIGTNPDDFFAFDFVAGSSRAEILCAVSGNGAPVERAQLARRALDLCDCTTVPSFAGAENGISPFMCRDFIDGSERIETDFIEAVDHFLTTRERVTYLAIQGMSNVAALLRNRPELNDRLDIVHMGLTTAGYEEFTDGGTNMRADPLAARFVYEQAKNLLAVGLQTTLRDDLRIGPGTAIFEMIAASSSPRLTMLREHMQEFFTRRGVWPAMHDPLTAAAALKFDFVEFESVTVEFNSDGHYRKGGPVRVAVSKPESKIPEFLELQRELFFRHL